MKLAQIAALLLLASATQGCTTVSPGGGVAGGGVAGGGVDSSLGRVRAEVERRAATQGALGPTQGTDPGVGPAVAALLAQPLTEDSAVKLALLQNGTVRETYERLGIARADLLQAGLLKNPVFTFNTKFFSAGPEIELGLAQSFLDLFFRPLRRRVAQAALQAEEAAVTRDLVRLVYDVRRAFVAVHAADEVVEIELQAQLRANAARDLMQQLHAAGNALDTVRTVEETGAARAQLDVDAARAQARDAREPLNVLLGLQGPAVNWTLAAVAPDLADAPADAPADARAAREVPLEGGVEQRALSASLDLLESRARINAAACQAGLTRREGLWPGLDLGVVGKREPGDGAWGVGPQLAATLPLFDAGQARVLASQTSLRRLLAHHGQLEVEVQAAARRLSARLEALRARTRYLRDVYLPLRERLVREGLQFFNAMQIGAFDVLHAKQQELDARREQAQTQRDAWTAALDLRELLAGSLNPARLGPLELPDPAEHPQAPKGH